MSTVRCTHGRIGYCHKCQGCLCILDSACKAHAVLATGHNPGDHDPCICGHARFKHDPATGCRYNPARPSSVILDGDACDCMQFVKQELRPKRAHTKGFPPPG